MTGATAWDTVFNPPATSPDFWPADRPSRNQLRDMTRRKLILELLDNPETVEDVEWLQTSGNLAAVAGQLDMDEAEVLEVAQSVATEDRAPEWAP